MSDEFNEIIGHYFTSKEWEAWTKGKFNLFDNFVKRTGMSEADANRLRNKFQLPTAPPQKTLTKEEVKSILKDNERNNT